MHGGAEGDALSACTDGVGGVFDVGACEDVRVGVGGCAGGVWGRVRGDSGVEEERGADAEEGVWAY